MASSWKSSFSNVPKLTKSLSTAVTIMSFFGFALRFRDMAYGFWHRNEEEQAEGFANSEALLVHLLAMVPISSWGSRAFFKYLAITSVGTMLGVYLTSVFLYVLTRNDAILYETQAYGLTCVISGFLIGFKQLVPEHQVTLWRALSVRMIQGFIFKNQLELMMAIYGLFISWIYSRFFRVQDGIRGDRSEEFSFASFFPSFLQTPVKHISNASFGILVRLGICSPTGFGGSFRYDLENPQMSGLGHTFTQPGSLRAEAERRRALALKALDMRIHAAMGNSGTGVGRHGLRGTSTAKPGAVSLLSLSAEPLPDVGDEDEDEILFETDALDVNGPPPSKSQTEKLDA
ncbi:hypothetical protein BGZ94_009292 [Podila epigama]|nr:hypothetical protein BGZ94_009292 [Podila epigama]